MQGGSLFAPWASAPARTIVPVCALCLFHVAATFSFAPVLPIHQSKPCTSRLSSALVNNHYHGNLLGNRNSGLHAHWNSWRRRDTIGVGMKIHPHGNPGAKETGNKPPSKQRGMTNLDETPLSRRAVLGLGVGLLLLGNGKAAEAGFGPAGGAAISPPPVKRLTLEDLLQLGQDKREQRAKSLFEKNINSILDQLENKASQDEQTLPEFNKLIDQLREDAMYAKLEEKVKQRNSELAAQKEIERQLKARQKLLDRLDKQPQWVSYGAAFFASVTSTLIMHPVDTLKVRLMGAQAQKEVEVEDNFYSAPPAEDGSTNEDGEGEGEGEDPALQLQVGTTNDTERWGQSTHGGGASEGGVVAVQVPALEKMAVDGARGEVEVEGEGEEVPVRLVTAAASSGTVTIERRKLRGKGGGEEEEGQGQGLLSLYDGLSSNIMKEAPSSALYLGVYEAARTALNQTPLSQYELLVYLLAGAVGELFGSVIRAPSEAVKTRVQTSEDDTMEAVRSVLLTPQGRRNTFKAWSSSLFRDVPAGAVQIAMFEGLKIFILSSPNLDFDVGTLQAEAMLGSFGGGFAAFLTTPTDVTTTTLLTSASQGKDLQLGEVARAVWETDGVKGFFTGSVQRTLYWAPAIGIFLSVYCSLRQFAITQGF